ncbi:MAG: helix-turn-helix transcriptional regulator [Butyrivibrio sp.]|nr:helix-turn-helix transcriptional regulator [Butyrivibrio sp.]
MDDIFSNYDYTNLAENIKSTRKLRGSQYKEYMKNPDSLPKKYKDYACCVNQETLAEAVNVSRQTIIDWEKGNTCPSIENLIQLCKVFNCNPDYLLGFIKTPVIEPVSIAHYFSHISSDIIKFGLEHKDYLDCLNFFMLPKNCSSLFNKVTLTAWRNFWVDSSLLKIKNSFKDELLSAYEEYSAVTPISDISKKTYADFLKKRFPEKELIFKTKKKEDCNGFYIKGCFELSDYNSFFDDKVFNHQKFIQYLAETTFEPLSHRALIESQKIKLANTFVNLFTRYLEE